MSELMATLASLAKIAAVAVALVAVFIVSGYLGVYWALSTEEFEVPEVIGMELPEATGVLTAHGLIVEIDARPMTDDVVPEGLVLRQNPPAGTAIKRQRGIRLTLSAGPPRRALPVTVGNALQQAQISLEQKGVGVEYVARVHSTEFGKDRVIGQQPSASELPEGADVPLRLLVSLGAPPTTYLMPDLVYRNAAEVGPWLERMGFQVRIRDSASRVRGQPPGTIVSHVPSPGFPVRVGIDVIDLWVNR